MSARDEQVGGDHYSKHAMQPIDIIDAYNLNFYEGNALKYLLRYKDKNGVEDLKKAVHYIQMLIEREEAKNLAVLGPTEKKSWEIYNQSRPVFPSEASKAAKVRVQQQIYGEW